jgi:8-oxo-dGTP pyrophosphatase MutT (NUDIX family)
MKTLVDPKAFRALRFENWRAMEKITPLLATKFLVLNDGIFQNLTQPGHPDQHWTWVSRTNADNPVSVAIRDAATNRYLLIAQPRIPNQRIVVSFPAGMREGKTALATALAEVTEETGYNITAKELSRPSPPLPKSAGLTDEADTFLTATVHAPEVHPAKPEATETIVATWMTPRQFLKETTKYNPATTVVEMDTYKYLRGMVDGWNQICKDLPANARALQKKYCKK